MNSSNCLVSISRQLSIARQRAWPVIHRLSTLLRYVVHKQNKSVDYCLPIVHFGCVRFALVCAAEMSDPHARMRLTINRKELAMTTNKKVVDSITRDHGGAVKVKYVLVRSARSPYWKRVK